VITNADGVFLVSLAITCDQQRIAIGPVILIVLRPSNGRLH